MIAILMFLLIATLLFLLANVESLLKALILMEMLGLFWFCLLVTGNNCLGVPEGVNLLFFSILVLEGVIGLFGLVLMLKFSNSDAVMLMNV